MPSLLLESTREIWLGEILGFETGGISKDIYYVVILPADSR